LEVDQDIITVSRLTFLAHPVCAVAIWSSVLLQRETAQAGYSCKYSILKIYQLRIMFLSLYISQSNQMSLSSVSVKSEFI